MVYAEYEIEREFSLRLLESGESVTVNPHVHHNIYLSAKTILHTIKYGNGISNDWFPSPELDELTKQISESEIFNNHRFLE